MNDVQSPAPTPIDQGRQDLADWKASQPDNFWTADPLLPRMLARIGGPGFVAAMDDKLTTLGAACATTLDDAAAVNNRPHNLPLLERYDGIGRRTEGIEHHPSYHVAGRVIYEGGVIAEYAEPRGFLRALSLFQLTSMCGEAGHNCPVACTAGIVKTLQGLGTPELQARYLPGLLSRTYETRLDGAQFLTEVQGGSDVGLNATRAVQDAEGNWTIHGEKWFCSNADADLILMTARWDDGTGTRGLGLFLVPRVLPDGTVNRFHLRRLKDKLGTRSMPSGEIDFVGATAYCMGAVEDGFRNMMTFVINVSRLYNAFATAGAARRAWMVARGYAQHRRAFGRPIGDWPLVTAHIAHLAAETAGMAAASYGLAQLLDEQEAGGLDETTRAYLRMSININKLRTARSAVECTLDGIETLGGNGAIESFSILPRLHRDMIVCENWEGTHNTLTAQTWRDMQRYRMHDAWLAVMRGRLAAITASATAPLVTALRTTIDALEVDLAHALTLGPDVGAWYLRPRMDTMGWLLFAAGLVEQAAHEATTESEGLAWATAQTFVERRFAPPADAEAFGAPRLERLRQVAGL